MNTEYTDTIKHRPYSDDEISIVDLWLLLKRRKIAVAVIWATVICLAVLYLLWAQPKYESRAVLAIGETVLLGDGNHKSLLESPDILVSRLSEQYKIDDDSEGERELPYLLSISDQKRASDAIIILTSIAYSAEAAQTFLQTLIDRLLAEHNAIYQKVHQQQETLLQTKQQSLADIDRGSEQMLEMFEQLKTTDPTQASLVTIEQSQLLQRQADMQADYRRLQILLTTQSKPTRVLRPPTLTIDPTTPKYLFTIFLAIILGGMFACVLVLIVEFIKKMNQLSE